MEWHYGPTAWDPYPGSMWHYGCPDEVGAGHGGQVVYWKDGSASCLGCSAHQASDEGDEP
jgi:hypothetical protein